MSTFIGYLGLPRVPFTLFCVVACDHGERPLSNESQQQYGNKKVQGG